VQRADYDLLDLLVARIERLGVRSSLEIDRMTWLRSAPTWVW